MKTFLKVFRYACLDWDIEPTAQSVKQYCMSYEVRLSVEQSLKLR